MTVLDETTTRYVVPTVLCTDSEPGLNRAGIMESLQLALADAARDGTGVAAVFVDLDGFSSVNDRLGRAAGDAMLRTIAACLQTAVRDDDAVGRLGGDEFLVLGRAILAPSQALPLADRLAEALARAFAAEPPHHAVASIGVTWCAGVVASDVERLRGAADTMVLLADSAMCESKAQGLGRPVFRTLHPWDRPARPVAVTAR